MNSRIFLLAALLGVAVVSESGCSSHRRETSSTEVTVEDSSRASFDADRPIERTESRSETVESESGDHGFFHIVGDIIALPFRALGAIF